MKINKLRISQVVNKKTEEVPIILGNVLIFLITLQAFFFPYAQSQTTTNFNLTLHTMYISTISFYTIIVFGIVFYKKYGQDFYLDSISLWMIVISCFVRITYGINYEAAYQLWLMLLGIVLAVFIVKNRKSIKTPRSKSFLIGIGWGIVTVILVIIALSDFPIKGYYSRSVNWWIGTLMYNLSFVTVLEEVVFRGLLVGLLVMKGYKEDIAFVIQGILFWIIHYSNSSNTVLFFIALPILTLSTTLIVRKYKMLYLSIMIHTLVNILPHYLVDF